MAMKIWVFIMAAVAVLIILSVVWPSFPLKSASTNVLAALGIGLLLADHAFRFYRT